MQTVAWNTWEHMGKHKKTKQVKNNDNCEDPGLYLRGVHGSQFHMESSAPKPHSNCFDSLFILTPHPTPPSLSPADGGSFVHQHPGNNIKGLLGINAECLKNKTNPRNKEVPEEMGNIHDRTSEREGKSDGQGEIKK